MIDTTFDFTSELTGYWDGFWERKGGLGSGAKDPDSDSKTLKEYHRLLWSKELPNGEIMELEPRKGADYLFWNGMCFGSDSIIVSFRYYRYKYMLDQIADAVDDYRRFVEDYIHRSYTIGGTIIFPKHRWSMNQAKGTNKRISDRWDLTLECIRKYYNGESSPLWKVIERDKRFYDLFLDFKGYVDFFLLQDCVSDDYSKVKFFIGDGDFDYDPLPKTVDEYFLFMDREREFLEKRNARIANYSRSFL